MNRWGQLPLAGDDLQPEDPRRRARPFFTWLILIVVLITLIFTIFNRSQKNKIAETKQPSLEEILSEYRKIIQLPQSTGDGQLQTLRKSGAVLVTSRYLSQADTDVIIRYYQRELARNGWSLRRDFGDGRNTGRSYCKGALQASVEIGEPTKQPILREYAVSISWSGVSKRECRIITSR
jgi:hypothetical protein